MKKILCVVGTRPEAIKMSPVIMELNRSDWAEVRVLATAQHRDLLDQVLGLFRIVPDIDLNIMRQNQDLSELTARLLQEMKGVLDSEKPHAVIAQGDTTTVMTAALSSYYARIPFGHVEAGLRTGDLFNPFPEEMNRVVAGRLARWHFAPTQSARQNLLAEGLPAPAIFVTGNTVIDALLQVSSLEVATDIEFDDSKKLILVTSHRRENFGDPFEEICRAIRHLADTNPGVEFLYPMHPNPNVRSVANRELSNHQRIRLCEPLDYAPFVAVMKKAYLMLTDSGGVQEEAPALGKPVLVMRHETERPEAEEAGVVKLVGPVFESIVREVQRLLDDEDAYHSMARGVSPYGDGKAAGRIANILRRELTEEQ